MGVLPRKTQDLIDFCQARSMVWSQNAGQIGIEDDLAGDFAEAVGAASSNHAAQVAAAAAAKGATEASRTTLREMRRLAVQCIRRIRLFASNQEMPGAVYALAQIPAPQTPSTMPPPGTPGDFRATLNPDGSLTIAWKCSNPSGATGTVYAIRRRADISEPWAFLGAVGTKKFTDHALPPVTRIYYQVQAQRGASLGLASSSFNVQFGAGGAGMMITSQFEDAKTAA